MLNCFWWGIRPVGGRKENATNRTDLDGGSHLQQMIVSDFLKQEGLTCFIPMRYAERQAGDESKPRRILVPVIHNYVFVGLEMPMKQFCSLLAKCATPLYILKHRDTDSPVEISNREMMEFRMLCDPAFEQRVNIIQQGEEPEVGKEVEIIHGPFAGVHGRLYRKQKKYCHSKPGKKYLRMQCLRKV